MYINLLLLYEKDLYLYRNSTVEKLKFVSRGIEHRSPALSLDEWWAYTYQ